MGDDGHLTRITGSTWAFLRDVAIRAPGFPVDGLDAFGDGEAEALAEVARDERFQEAVTWQNRDTLRNAVRKVAADGAADDSAGRRRLDTVASYWQRYTAKNDTIGFFGPLGWGELVDDEDDVVIAPGDDIIGSRVVRFEVWAMQTLADVVGARIGAELRVGTSPAPETHLRELFEAIDDEEARKAALGDLDRLESALDDVRAATGAAAIEAALDRLDIVFADVTGAASTRNPGVAYGARTLCYLDCRRDVDVRLGPTFRDVLGEALLPLLPPARWYCGEMAAIVSGIARAVADDMGVAQHPVPAGPVFGQAFGAQMAPPPVVAERLAEVRRRFQTVLDGGAEGAAARSEAAFADWRPAWRASLYMSPDVQIAARDVEAVRAGDCLFVCGDFHSGIATHEQAFMLEQHPDPDELRRRFAANVQPPRVFPVPSPTLPRMTGRIMPTWVTPDDVSLLTAPDAAMPARFGAIPLGACTVEDSADGLQLVGPGGGVRGPLDDALFMAMFLMTVRSYSLIPDDDHVPRVTVGRAVYRRETWNVVAAQASWALAKRVDVGAARRWADRLGLPARVFVLAPVEEKPFYVDLRSPTLLRALGRALKRTVEVHGDAAKVRVSEMLPAPEDCWLPDADGRRYTSELRLCLVDMERWPSPSPWTVAAR